MDQTRRDTLFGPLWMSLSYWVVMILVLQVPPAALAAHAAWVKGQKEVAVLMLLTMDLEIQRNLAHLGAYDMLQELKAMYSKQAQQELLQTVREFHTSKQEEGQSVSSYVLKMKCYIENLERLGQPVGRVQKNQKNKSHKAGKGSHGKGKGKGKMGNASNNASFASKPKTPPLPKKYNPAKDAICHQCGEVGHWRRNCPVYLAELMKKKKLSQGASTSGALSLYVGDGHRTAVEAIETYHLELPSGLDIVLNNCHYAPSITKDSSLLWHCRLGHISKKRIEKLQHGGLLNTIDIESLGKCVSCMSGKMARKPYSHQVERAKDLHGLIHTDETMGNSFYNPSENKVLVARNAEFFESKLLDLKASGSMEDLELIQEEDTNPYVDTGLDHEEDNQEIDEP
nr:zinc finger, CCHC-type [Tanacetum cinerariifolium]